MALRAGRVGVNPADVNPIDGHISLKTYSVNKRCIGKTDEGKKIYEQTFNIDTPESTTSSVVIPDINSTDHIIYSISGMINLPTNYSIPINYNTGSGDFSVVWGAPDGIRQKITTQYVSKPETINIIFSDK